jgi:hypothetical protein
MAVGFHNRRSVMCLALASYVFVVFLSPLLYYPYVYIQQKHHIETICASTRLNVLLTDVYVEKPLHAHVLCPYLWDAVNSGNQTRGPYEFSEIDLHKLDILYMQHVYNRRNFPYTFRYDVSVRFDNHTANEILRRVCRRCSETDDPCPNAGYYIGAFMVVLICGRFAHPRPFDIRLGGPPEGQEGQR